MEQESSGESTCATEAHENIKRPCQNTTEWQNCPAGHDSTSPQDADSDAPIWNHAQKSGRTVIPARTREEQGAQQGPRGK